MADTITSLIIQIRAESAQAIADVKNFVAQSTGQLKMVENETTQLGEAAQKTGVHVAGMSYYFRGGVDSIRAVFAGGGARAGFYAIDESIRGLISSGVQIGTLVPILGALGAAAAGGIFFFKELHAEEEATRQATNQLTDSFKEMPSVITRINMAARGGILSPEQKQALLDHLGLVKKTIQESVLTLAPQSLTPQVNAQAPLHIDLNSLGLPDAVDIRAVNEELAKSGILLKEIDEKGKVTYTVNPQIEALDKLAELERKLTLERLSDIERERIAAKQKYDEEIQQIKQLAEIAGSKADPEKIKSMMQSAADAYQNAIGKIQVSEMQRMAREQSESQAKIKAQDAKDAAGQIEDLEDNITVNQIKNGDDRKKDFDDEYKRRIFLYQQLLYSGEITEQEYKNRSTKALKERADAEREYNAQSERDKEQQAEIDRARIEGQLDAIRQNPFATEQSKIAASLPLQRQLLALDDQRLVMLQKIAGTSKDDDARINAEKQVVELTKQREELVQKIADAENRSSFSYQFGIAITDLQNKWTTFAMESANAFKDAWTGATSSVSNGLADLIDNGYRRGQALTQMWNGFIGSITQSFTNMVTSWIMNHVIMGTVSTLFHTAEIGKQAAATSTQVGIHTAGEQAKTGASMAGALARGTVYVFETMAHGVQVGLRLAAHLVAEAVATAATIANAIKRIMAWAMTAGAGAASAEASIPYVGPILAVAAMAAMIGTVMALTNGLAMGGLVTGPGSGTSDSILTRLSAGEYVIPAARVHEFGAGFFDNIRNGAVRAQDLANMAAPAFRPSAAIRSAPTGAPARGGGETNVHNAVYFDKSKLVDELARSDAHEKFIVDVMSRNIHRFRS